MIPKRRLAEVIETFLEPIRTRRTALARDLEPVRAILREGTARGRARAAGTLMAVRRAMRLYDDFPGAPG